MPYLSEMSWRRVEEYFSQSDCIAIGTGALHAHDHIPVGIDNVTTEFILDKVEEKTGLLVVGTMPFGAMVNYAEYPGSLSIKGQTFYDVIEQITDGLYDLGARRFVFVNGCGGNSAHLLEIGYRLRERGALAPILEWWKLIRSINADLNEQVNAVPSVSSDSNRMSRTRGVETAAAMALIPQAIDSCETKVLSSRNIFGDDLPTMFNRGVKFDGVQVPMPLIAREIMEEGTVATCATPEMGQKVLDECVDFIARFIERLRECQVS